MWQLGLKMSKFTSPLINGIVPYVPGEQPRDKQYVKLNTNENPYFTSESAAKSVNFDLLSGLNRYSDPESNSLIESIAKFYGVEKANVLVTNGSDEALAFTFLAYCKSGVCYPDVTYGFYNVIANLFGCPVEKKRLNDEFTINVADYLSCGKTVVIANPNAQTGIELARQNLIKIIESNEENVVIVDQAYADFGSYNAVELIKKYKNLITVNTFSKSRSLAGARVGYVIADENLIADIKKVKNSFHPYNVNSVSAALAKAAMDDVNYFKKTVEKVKNTRRYLSDQLTSRGFTVLPSSANFLLAKTSKMSGENLYLNLKEKGVLVRYFSDERIYEYVRITVGTECEVDSLLRAIDLIFTEQKV